MTPLLACGAVGTVDVDHGNSSIDSWSQRHVSQAARRRAARTRLLERVPMTTTGNTSSELDGHEVRPGRVAAAVALMALAAIVALGWALQQPPAPVPASAPAQIFSAERAYADLQRIAGPEPTPIGSVGSDAIRDHLVAALSAAGFNVEVQTGVGSQTFESTTVAGRVDNVVATLAGQDSTGSVVLAAHDDSTFGTPGASDDKGSGPSRSRSCWRGI